MFSENGKSPVAQTSVIKRVLLVIFYSHLVLTLLLVEARQAFAEKSVSDVTLSFETLTMNHYVKPFHFLEASLHEKLRQLVSELAKLRFDKPINSLEFYYRLSPESKSLFRLVLFGRSKLVPRAEIAKKLNELNSIEIDISGKKTRARYNDNRNALNDYHHTQLMRMAHPFLYEQNKGIFVTVPGYSQQLYFLPLAKTYYRAYTLDSKDLLRDRSYVSLCKSLYRKTEPSFYSYLMRTFLEGFPSSHKRGEELSTSSLDLLFDIVGIALAEHYLMEAKGYNYKQILHSHNLVTTVLLSLHLARGGSLPVFDRNKSVKLQSGNCKFLMGEGVTYDMVLSRQRNEKMLSAYFQSRHPKLYQTLVEGLNSSNLFEGLTRAIHGKNEWNNTKITQLKQLIVKMSNETADIDRYLKLEMTKQLSTPLPPVY